MLHWLYGGIWQSTTRRDSQTTNTVEDRWKKSISDQKHVLGTDSSNAGWWGNQLNKIIKHGVTQGRVLSPDLFSPCNEIIMQNLEGYPRIKVGGHNIHHLRFPATLLIRHLRIRKQKEKVWNEEQKDRSNGGSPSNECPHINIFNKRNKLKQKNQFQILFTLISSDGCNFHWNCIISTVTSL